MSVDIKTTNKAFIRSLKRIAKELSKPESDISKAEFFAHDSEGISEWDLRKCGGYNDLKTTFFQKEENIEFKYGSALVRNHLRKIDRAHGQSLFYEKELLEGVKAHLEANPLIVHKPVKLEKRKSKCPRTIVAAISDTHFGANISKEEMHGLNEYNWTIASRRMALYMEQVANYKLDHRDETDLLVQINGDIIAGLIHNQEWFCDLLTTQFAGAVHLLSQAMTYVAQHFDRVKIVCTVGNHGRNMAKHDKGRATTNKWDAFETMVYLALKYALEKHTNIEVVIPESPYIVYKVQGHNVLQTHGDTVVNVGNPGKSLNMDSINNQINRITSSALFPTGEKLEVVSVGHVHVGTVQTLDSGCTAVINGCGSGTDPFAQSIGIFGNTPMQLLFESTPKNAVGDIRMIHLQSADKESRFDKIIKPFQGKF